MAVIGIDETGLFYEETDYFNKGKVVVMKKGPSFADRIESEARGRMRTIRGYLESVNEHIAEYNKLAKMVGEPSWEEEKARG